MKSKQIICCLLAAAVTAGTVASTAVYALDNENEDANISAIAENPVTADEVSFSWDRSDVFGITIETDSLSKEIALRKENKLLATSITSRNLSVEDGLIYIDTAILGKLDDGENTLTLVLKEGTLEITVNITDESPEEEFALTADTTEFTWDRSNEFGISVQTNSQSRQIALRKENKLFATSVINSNLAIEDGNIYIGSSILNKLTDGENHLTLVLKEGTLDLTIHITDEYTEESSEDSFTLTVDATEFTWDRNDTSDIIIQTNSQSKQIALRKDDKLFATSMIHSHLAIENGQITIGKTLLRKLNDGENTLLLVLKEGTLEITVNVTDEQTVVPIDEKEITAKTVDFTWDRSDLIGIAVYTNSSSKNVTLLKDGEPLVSNEDRGLYITLGRVGITSKVLKQLDNGENTLTLAFDDGTLAINVNVTDKKNINTEETSITADKVSFTWDRSSSNGISIHTDSVSETLVIRKDGSLFASSDGKNLLISDGTVTMTAQFLNKLDNGTNHLKLIFEDGTLDITVTVTDQNNTNNSRSSTNTNGSWANTDYNYGSNVPDTGSTAAAAAAALAALSAGTAGILTVFKKKKNSKNK